VHYLKLAVRVANCQAAQKWRMCASLICQFPSGAKEAHVRKFDLPIAKRRKRGACAQV
jgi:hypothetical protein